MDLQATYGLISTIIFHNKTLPLMRKTITFFVLLPFLATAQDTTMNNLTRDMNAGDEK
jgi:hypothetical protein